MNSVRPGFPGPQTVEKLCHCEAWKKENDHPSIGLLLCKSKNDLVAEYALKDMSKPMGVSAYKVTSSLPEELQRQLPSIEDIEKRIQRESFHGDDICCPCIHKSEFVEDNYCG